jgi:hypothetical protein
MRDANEPAPAFSRRAASSAADRQSRERSCNCSSASRASVSKGVPSSCAIGLLRAVEQARLHEVLRQRGLRTLALGARQAGAREQELVQAHRALVFAAAAKQVAEREVQLGAVGVVLHDLDEGIDRLVLLFIEQQVQSLQIGLRRFARLALPLAQIDARRKPAEGEGQRQSEQQPLQLKVHRAPASRASAAQVARRVARRCRLGPMPARDAAMPPPARHHREHAEDGAERERDEHDEDHRRVPLLPEEPLHGGVVLVVQREREQRKEDGGPEQPDEDAHHVLRRRF